MKSWLPGFLRFPLLLWCIGSVVVLPIHLPPAMAQSEPALRPRVAVLEFEGVGVQPAEAAAVTDQLRSDLVRLKVFTVLDRAQTQTVLEELALQQTGVTDPGQAVKIGKLLNVEYIVTGRITALTDAYQVNAQMIRVETGVIERSESILYQGHILGLLSDNIASIAARLGAVDDTAKAGAPLAASKEGKAEEEGTAWWVWALVGLGVLGLAAALGGGADDAAPAASTSACPTGPGTCGSVSVTW